MGVNLSHHSAEKDVTRLSIPTSPHSRIGKKLDRSVVQRIQRFSQGSVFKRSVLQAIAAELLAAPAAAVVGSEKGGHQPRGMSEGPDSEGDDDLDAAGDDVTVDVTASGGFRPVVSVPSDAALKALYDRLDLGEGEGDTVGMDQLGIRLKAMGEHVTSAPQASLIAFLDPE